MVIRKAIVVHGYGAVPTDHWFPWTVDALSRQGIHAEVPAMPNPDAPEPSAWDARLNEALGGLASPALLIGHSLGGIALLRHLTRRGAARPLGLILVSPFVAPLPSLPELDPFLTVTDHEVRTLARHLTHVRVLRSDNDAIVPAAHSDHVSELLGTPSHIVRGAGHFLAAEGVTTLPAILEHLPGHQKDSRAGRCSTQ